MAYKPFFSPFCLLFKLIFVLSVAGCQTFIGQVVVRCADGSVETSMTAAGSWQGRDGPVVFDHFFHGETYDARLEVRLLRMTRKFKKASSFVPCHAGAGVGQSPAVRAAGQ